MSVIEIARGDEGALYGLAPNARDIANSFAVLF
jgi:hypothetical protein